MQDPENLIQKIRDLSDFCSHWEDLKPLVSPEALSAQPLSEATQSTIAWLVIMTDKTCQIDG